MDTRPSEDFRETSTLPDLFAPVPRSFDQIYLTNSGELPPPETFHFGTNLGEVAFVALKLWHLTQLHRKAFSTIILKFLKQLGFMLSLFEIMLLKWHP